MDTVARDIALILTALGAGVIVPKAAAALWGAITGGAARQRREVDRALQEAAEARRTAAAAAVRADDEAHSRRLAQEHASHLRRLLFEAPCVDAAAIPPFPTYERKTAT